MTGRILNNRLTAIVVALGLGLSPALDDAPGEPLADAVPAPEPTFRVEWLRGKLTVVGHTVSKAHEAALRAAVEDAFPKEVRSIEFLPLGVLPDHWAKTTSGMVRILRDSSSASAALTASTLTVRGVAENEDWQNELDAFERTLAAEIDLVTKVTIVEPADTSGLCNNAFESFVAGAINFEESTAEFRPSAYPRLERVVDLADACRDASVQIIGHTDASGPEDWNRRLSLMRAQAVANYLQNKGIEATRLIAEGAGSDTPVATNETRYGRSLNRRIEIRFSGVPHSE